MLQLINALNARFGLVVLELPAWVLPAGVSFFTFQACSYLVDVYRGTVPASRSLSEYALSMTFFPHLVAGPILRYEALAPALARRSHTLEAVAEGLGRFGLGLAKKILLADNLGRIADTIWGRDMAELTPALAWLGLAAYALQIFYDFSGYSDMAIGLGRVFALPLPENFSQPYTAQSVTEFWRRWHMTLSSWFRDYIYIPLGGNRRGPLRTALNLAVVFVLCGLWHGASVSFLVWGLYHGLLLSLERGFSRVLRLKVPSLLGWAITLLLVALGWVVFRSPSIEAAFGYYRALLGAQATASPLFPPAYFLTANNICYLVLAALCALWPATRTLSCTTNPRLLRIRPWLYLALACMAVIAQAPRSFNPFIYFQF